MRRRDANEVGWSLLAFSDVTAAARRVKNHVTWTPIIRSQVADLLLDARVVFKCENVQRSGTFKYRGAFNALCRWRDEQNRRGAIAISDGSHGLAVAPAANALNLQATILVPHGSRNENL